MIKVQLGKDLISRFKDLVVYLIGIVVGTQFTKSRLKHGNI
jgi:hypothetical protein